MGLSQNQSRTGSSMPEQLRLDILRLDPTFGRDVALEGSHSCRDAVSHTTELGDHLKVLRGEHISGSEADMIFKDWS